MKRSPIDIINNYVRRLADSDLEFVRSRLSENLSGDFASCLEFLQKSPDIDRLLVTSPTVDDFYEIIDAIQESVWNECSRRQGHHLKTA